MIKTAALVSKLPLIPQYDFDLDKMVEKPAHTFERDDILYVSAEHGDGAADYYGTDSAPYPTIHPVLEEFAQKRKLHWEWVNPACIALYD